MRRLLLLMALLPVALLGQQLGAGLDISKVAYVQPASSSVIYPSWFTPGQNNNILIIGDSFTVGIAADDSANGGWVPVLEYYLKKELGNGGSGFWGPHITGTGDTYSANFLKWVGNFTFGGGFGLYSVHGYGFNTKKDSIQLTGKIFDVIHYASTNAQSFNITIDDDAVTAVSTLALGAGFVGHKETITAAVNGAHEIRLSVGAGEICQSGGIIAYTGNAGVNVLRLGRSGSETSSYRSATTDTTLDVFMRLSTPKLTIIELGYNDYANQADTNLFNRNYIHFITEGLKYGQVCVLNNVHYYDGQTIPIEVYNGIIKRISDSLSCIYVDMHFVWGSSNDACNNGLTTCSSAAHPSSEGHRLFATKVYEALVGEPIEFEHGQDTIVTPASYEAEATALFARMTGSPTTARKNLINKTIKSLKDAGYYSRMDAIYVFAVQSQHDALLCWNDNSFDPASGGTLIFKEDTCIGGNGSTGYLDLIYNFTTDATNWTQDDAGMSMWVYGPSTTGTYNAGGSLAVTFYTSLMRFVINGWPNFIDGILPVRNRMWTASRPNNTTINFYQGGRLNTSGASNSVGVPNANMELFRYAASTYNNTKLSMFMLHDSFSQAEADGLYQIMDYYMKNK